MVVMSLMLLMYCECLRISDVSGKRHQYDIYIFRGLGGGITKTKTIIDNFSGGPNDLREKELYSLPH